MKLRTKILVAAVVLVALGVGYFQLSVQHRRKLIADPVARLAQASTWQQMAAPRELSMPHAFLSNNCAGCHTPVKGVEAKSCIVCHADNKTLLQRPPTAFHSDIGSCVECHREHQGNIPRTTKMDHTALARIGVRRLQEPANPRDSSRDALVNWLKQNGGPPLQPQLRREESLLNCAGCHQTKDRHNGLFGTDCAQCHGTEKWTVPEFRHPSTASQSCSQCHQAPPSHYMMHFQMISMTVAGQAHAKVDQCFLCHQTTSWNDIRGVGWYKHH